MYNPNSERNNVSSVNSAPLYAQSSAPYEGNKFGNISKLIAISTFIKEYRNTKAQSLDTFESLNNQKGSVNPQKYITIDNINLDELDVERLALSYTGRANQEISLKQKQQFQAFIENTYTEETKNIKIKFVNYQPYQDVSDAQKDYKQGFLRISTLGSESLVVDNETNLKWRVIHDCHHCQTNFQFTFEGELAVWMFVCKKYKLPDWMQGLIFSEIVFQTSTNYYQESFLSSQRNIMTYDD